MRFLLLFLFSNFIIAWTFPQEAKPLVFIAISEECPISIYMTKPLRELKDKYENSIDFKLIFPLELSNYKTMQQFKEKYKLKDFDSVLDEDQSLTKSLNLTITPEVVLLNKSGQIIYRGRINDAYYKLGKLKKSSIKNDLEEAIIALLKNENISEPWPKAVGCYITFRK